ncbi:MAG: nucleotidyltransferase family protein [Oscillospiraceae bacterium]|nr:nucleotidyltransferase family protein [Oscillospiraceae bacterium]MDD7469964.1 nucleotidyltransferase family protein [Oscillospiraceae bacterium]MDY2677946.1 nucleotidyltransferase family protein [Oscillospiraceae bacterium]
MFEDVLELLRAFIYGEEPKLSGKSNIEELLKFAYRQKLLGIFAYMNKRWSLFDSKKAKSLDAAYYSALFESTVRCSKFLKLSEFLSENKIEHMPVKGYYIRELYPVKELRSFGDIDILIHEKDRKRCDSLMKSLGYTVKNDWEPTYSYIKDDEYYEIHTNLFDVRLKDRADMTEYFSSAWLHAKKDSGLRFVPDTEFHLIYIICHLAKHLSTGGAGIRMYLDVALYILRYDSVISWERTEEEFKKLGLERFFHTVLSAVNEWFYVKASCDFENFGEELSELLEFTLDSDIFGHSRDNSAIKLRGEERSKKRTALKILFPPAEQLENRYTFLKRSRLLLPLAWIVRVFKNFGLIPKKIKELVNLKKAEISEVESFDSFMREIGL